MKHLTNLMTTLKQNDLNTIKYFSADSQNLLTNTDEQYNQYEINRITS